jgi:hypothetical protein
MVGDLQNNPGRSLFVRLTGPTSGAGASGKWTDSATGEHGDLLDIIRERTGITRFPDLLAEARAHLGRPQPVLPAAPVQRTTKSPSGTPEAASRLFAASLCLAGSLAETYLRARGITQAVPSSTLLFHPVDFHPEVTRVFHRELTRLKVMFCGLCWGQDMRGLPFRFGYC